MAPMKLRTACMATAVKSSAMQSHQVEQNVISRSTSKGHFSRSKTHLAAITEPARVGELLKMIDGYEGTPAVQAALKLAPLVFVRPGELRAAEWQAFDLPRAEWRFTVSKTATDHIVPLATQAISILENLRPITGNGQYVFPGARQPRRPMSNNAILAALRRMEIQKMK